MSNFDYEKHYSDLLKNALKYGMTRSEFWYGEDYRDYFLYQEAYYERLHETSHIQGYYNYIALSTIMGNMLAKKGSQALEYPRANILSQEKEKALKNENTKRLESMNKQELKEYYQNKLSQCY